MPFGQHERAVFEEQSTPLYEEVVTAGGIGATDPRIVEGGELHEAFRLLVEVGLLNSSDDGVHWRAVDPAAVQAQVVAPLGQQGAELIAESAHWAQAFSALSHVWRRSPSAVGGPFAEINSTQVTNRDWGYTWRWTSRPAGPAGCWRSAGFSARSRTTAAKSTSALHAGC